MTLLTTLKNLNFGSSWVLPAETKVFMKGP